MVLSDPQSGLGSEGPAHPCKEATMRASLKPRSIYDIFALLGCVAALGGGTAYAANTIGSDDVIDESLQSVDIKNGEVGTSDLKNSSVTSLKIHNGSVLTDEIGANAVD